jgi:hypothetical protein
VCDQRPLGEEGLQELSAALLTFLDVVTERVIAKAIHADVAEGDEVP